MAGDTEVGGYILISSLGGESVHECGHWLGPWPTTHWDTADSISAELTTTTYWHWHLSTTRRLDIFLSA